MTTDEFQAEIVEKLAPIATLIRKRLPNLGPYKLTLVARSTDASRDGESDVVVTEDDLEEVIRAIRRREDGTR